MCVIDVATKSDKKNAFAGQSMYVPWLICMDSKGDPTTTCNKQVGIDATQVKECLNSDAPDLLKEYMKVDAPIRATPTVHVNGKEVKTSYNAIKSALCSADPSLKGCSVTPFDDTDWSPDWQPPTSKVPPAPIVTV